MTLKEISEAFLKDSSSGKVDEAFDKYVHEDFIHHLIYFKGDRDTFRDAMKENSKQYPDKQYETRHVLEDGNLVCIHGKVTLGSKVYGVIHIFRFEDEKIIESWEASQEDIKERINENGLF